MEFWGVEVKAGESVKVVPDDGSMIHMSQAALGDSKGKGKGFIPLRVKIEDKKFILGSLSEDSIPHVTFDLVFHTEFELSHDSKDGSIFFLGYKGPIDDDDQGFPSDSEDESLNSEDELTAVNDETLKKLLASSNGVKPKSDNKPKVAVKEPVKDDDSSDSDDDEEDDDSSDDDDVPVIGQEDDSDDDSDDDDDEEDSSEEEETPKEVNRGKKRNAESPKEIPSSAKKVKVGTQPSKPAAVVNKSKGQAQKFQANKGGKKGGK